VHTMLGIEGAHGTVANAGSLFSSCQYTKKAGRGLHGFLFVPSTKTSGPK